MANKVWRIWFLWEYSISHGHWGNLYYTVSVSVRPRFDLESKPDKTREIKLVGAGDGERGQIVSECCKEAQVKIVYFYQQLSAALIILLQTPTIR